MEQRGLDLDLDHGKVTGRVATDQFRLDDAAVGEGDVDAPGVLDDMIVRDDVSLDVDDETRSRSEPAHVHCPGDVDVHDGRVHALVQIDQEKLFRIGLDDDRLRQGRRPHRDRRRPDGARRHRRRRLENCHASARSEEQRQ